MLRRYAIPLVFGTLAAASCAGPSYTGSPIMVNPDAVSPESGSTEEIRQVSQQTVGSFLDCARLDSEKRYRIVLDRIVNSTGLREYDERVFYNRLLSELTRVPGERFTFLDRRAVTSERAAQTEGAVSPTEPLKILAGADLVLSVELLSLRGPRTTTIQYNMRLTALDGSILCSETVEIKKRS